MKSIFIVIVMALTTNHAFAGGEVGNGGNVIVCADSAGNVKSVEVLDYYELRLNGGTLSLNPNLTTYQEKLFELFSRWKKVAPKRMDQYTKWLNEFSNEAGIYSGIEIPHIPDTGSIAIPQGCKPISIAFQRADGEIFPGTKRYVINKDLWDHMNETQKAGLVLHELIYREAIIANHATSLPTRYFNGYLSSAEPNQGEEYAYVVAKLPLLWVEYGGGLILRIGSIQTDCGFGGNCNPYFSRQTTITENGKIVAGAASEVIGDFNLNGWQIKFSKEQSTYSMGKFELNQLTREIDSDVDFYKISLIDKFNIQLKNENKSFERIRVTENNTIITETKQELQNTWIANNDGTIIQDISSFISNYYIPQIRTLNGGVWSWNSNKLLYTLDQYFINLKKEKIECNPKEDRFFECAQLPSKTSCNVKVFSDKKIEYIKENMLIISNKVYIKDGHYPGTYSSYLVRLPKGQVVGYEKKLGRTKAIKLDQDTYRMIDKFENEDCILF